MLCMSIFFIRRHIAVSEKCFIALHPHLIWREWCPENPYCNVEEAGTLRLKPIKPF